MIDTDRAAFIVCCSLFLALCLVTLGFWFNFMHVESQSGVAVGKIVEFSIDSPVVEYISDFGVTITRAGRYAESVPALENRHRVIVIHNDTNTDCAIIKYGDAGLTAAISLSFLIAVILIAFLVNLI